MRTYHIHIRGQVQGVGFRPFVYQLARSMGLNGWVNNTSDGVHIEVQAAAAGIEVFCQRLQQEAPALAKITDLRCDAVPPQKFRDFSIVHSQSEATPNLLLTPDFALCPDCRRELHDPENRRYRYPFITCTNCGPRYAIVEALPYDRERTVMDPFIMCPACSQEYHDPLDRRFFSQTNSCPECGIRLSVYDSTGQHLTESADACLETALRAFRDGQTVAVKGIGGYLLMADACNPEALQALRVRKRRPTKPFALLYPDLESLEQDVWLRDEERNMLLGPASPIALLPLREKTGYPLALEQIAPGLSQIGAMLPYAPLLELLAKGFGGPLVATSGNISHSPIVFQDKKALDELPEVAGLLLSHNRPIVVPQDDSVVRFSESAGQAIVIRRSRGLAPSFLPDPTLSRPECRLAMGADLKSAFGLTHGGNFFISQYLGDLVSWDTQQSFRHTLMHLRGLFQAKPEVVLADLHPGYFSHQLGAELARELGVPFLTYQHHQAHFAAVLAENGLLEQPEPVLGVIFDGTGLGADGQIWGGEFFRYQEGDYSRIGHIQPFPHLAGDKMAREPRLSALAIAHAVPETQARLERLFSKVEWQVYQRMLEKTGHLHSTSIGRLFDGVAALIGLKAVSSYEGEAAMLLEDLVRQYLRQNGAAAAGGYESQWEEKTMPLSGLVEQVETDLGRGVEAGKIAARFHGWLVEGIAAFARVEGVRKLAFSGGVWQNAVLVDWLILRLGKDYELFFHRQLSPNDEGISFGQLMLHQFGSGGIKGYPAGGVFAGELPVA